jgi:hypothetical protein
MTNAVNISQVGSNNTTFRNRIINGAMSFWQRATTYSGTPNPATYTSSDRWNFYSASPITASRSTDVASGFQYSLKLQRPNAATTTNNLYTLQVIESTNMLDLQSQSVTVSFWAKAGANFSASSSVLNFAVNTGTVADQGSASAIGGWTGNAYPIITTATLTTTWTRYTATGAVASNALEMGVLFWFTPTGTAGADDSVYITGVQLEAGSAASPFEYRSYGTELALCQRYYTKSFETNTAPGTATSLGVIPICIYLSGNFTWQLGGTFIVPMRSAPTVSYWDANGNASKVSYLGNGTTTFNNNVALASGGPFNASTSGFTFQSNVSTNGTYFIQYTASAEL